MFKSGISREGDIIDLGVNLGIVKKAGAFYTYGEQKLGQGRENAKDYLIQHGSMADEIEALIRAETINAPAKG
jgi:recombination protein RecA